VTADCAYTHFAVGQPGRRGAPALLSSLALLDLARSIGPDVAIVSSSGTTLATLFGGEPPPGVRIVDLESTSEWARYQVYTVDTDPPIDPDLMGRQLLQRLEDDIAEHGRPDVMILECTGLPPFRHLIRRVFRGPLMDVAGFVKYLLDVPMAPSAQRGASS
jgi:hypothetical protein